MNSKMSQLYLSGESASTIAKQFGLTKQTVLYHLRRGKVNIRKSADVVRALTDTQEEDLVSKYLRGISINELHKEYKISLSTVSDILTKHRIKHRSMLQAVGYHAVLLPDVDTNLFLYFIGLLLTDGWIYIRKNSRTIGFGSKDHMIVKYLADHISPGRKIYTESHDNSNFYRILLPITKEQVNMLNMWGCHQRKSLTLQPTKNLMGLSRAKFMQLLVGLIEGDGSILYNNNVGRVYYYSTENFCRFVRNTVGFGTIVKCKTIWRCTWSYRQAHKLVSELLNSEIRILDRKWRNAAAICNHYKVFQ